MINFLYPTPVYESCVDNFEECQKEVENIISLSKFESRDDWSNSHKISDPSFNSNVLFEYDCKTLTKEIHEKISDYLTKINFHASPMYFDDIKYNIATSWIALLDPGEHSHTHIHGSSDISGVYYYDTDPTENSFYVECPVPRMECSNIFQHLSYRKTYKPSPGNLIMFPGWMPHGVLKNQTDKKRYSLSFNVYFVNKERYYA